MNYYIIKSDSAINEERIGIPIATDMTFTELVEYVRKRSKLVHPRGSDTIFKLGASELINPVVMTPNDYAQFLPYIL